MAEVWSAVNVREDPELKDLLLGGELNIVECAACKEPFHVDAFMLYHDPENEIIAFVFPMDETLDKEMMAEKMNLDFEASQATLPENERLAYGPVMLQGLNELVTFVEQEEEVALQGEVLEAIAKENGIPVRHLRPSRARDQELPRALPMLASDGRSDRDALIAGLQRLRELNDRLTVYTETLSRVSKDPSASISFL